MVFFPIDLYVELTSVWSQQCEVKKVMVDRKLWYWSIARFD